VHFALTSAGINPTIFSRRPKSVGVWKRFVFQNRLALPRDLYGEARGGGKTFRTPSRKKTQATPKRDPEIAKNRFGRMSGARKMSEPESYASVWDAITDTPEQAANLRARDELMQKIAARLKEHGWTQAEAAIRCGVTQPWINDLLRGRVSRFSLDAPVNICDVAGLPRACRSRSGLSWVFVGRSEDWFQQAPGMVLPAIWLRACRDRRMRVA
jgi:predicted XRE-type DNA-binding protein